jgi:hypothetical protein
MFRTILKWVIYITFLLSFGPFVLYITAAQFRDLSGWGLIYVMQFSVIPLCLFLIASVLWFISGQGRKGNRSKS